jgi:hypothetical protein
VLILYGRVNGLTSCGEHYTYHFVKVAADAVEDGAIRELTTASDPWATLTGTEDTLRIKNIYIFEIVHVDVARGCEAQKRIAHFFLVVFVLFDQFCLYIT